MHRRPADRIIAVAKAVEERVNGRPARLDEAASVRNRDRSASQGSDTVTRTADEQLFLVFDSLDTASTQAP